mgnify:CR=1 FL=1
MYPILAIHAREILDYLHPRYPMTIVTNGFDEIQTTKIQSAGIGVTYGAHPPGTNPNTSVAM